MRGVAERAGPLWLLLSAALGLAVACAPSPGAPPERDAGPPPAAGAPADGSGPRSPADAAGPPDPGAPGSPAAAAAAAPLVVFLGDSLTAGLGVGEAEAFPEQVRRRLVAEGIGLRVINAGVSGDTTAGGLARLDWLLRQQPDVLVVGLGANDGLRGLALEETEANLRAIVETARRGGARVLLLGMLLPPNYGPDYTEGFRQIYPRLAEELDLARVPFLLDGVAGRPELNQADGIHPTAEGHRRMAANVAPAVRRLLESGG